MNAHSKVFLTVVDPHVFIIAGLKDNMTYDQFSDVSLWVQGGG